MPDYSIPHDLLNRLINIGARESFHELRQILTPEEISFHKQMMIQGWQFWYPIAENLTQDDLISLIKSLTMAESLLEGWQGGSVSAVIWLFRKYNPISPADKDSLADWILRHTDNGWVPFSNFGARNLNDYYQRHSEYLDRKRETQIKEELRHQNAVKKHAVKATKYLFPAISRGDVHAVNALILKGADLDARNSEGLTPMQWAVKCGKQDIANILNRTERG